MDHRRRMDADHRPESLGLHPLHEIRQRQFHLDRQNQIQPEIKVDFFKKRACIS